MITRGTGVIHANTALKIALGKRDVISKDRSKRHWTTPFHLDGIGPIPKGDDIVKFLYYAIKSKKSTLDYDVVQIVCLEDSDGNKVKTSRRTASGRFRGTVLALQGRFYSDNYSTRITEWLPVKKVIGEVRLQEGHCELTEQSALMLQEAGYSKNGSGKEQQIEKQQDEQDIPDGYFHVEDIMEKRLIPMTHETEYLVRYKGYGSSENEWLPPETFLNPVNFTSISRYGRMRKHTTKNYPGKQTFCI